MQEEKTSLWRFYLMEAAGLAGFVAIAGLATILLEHPELPVMKSWWGHHPVLRRVLLGVLMGFYVWLTTILWGKSSGAHFNPSVTWAFYRLQKISFWQAVAYTIAQFIGAITAALLLKALVGEWFGHPAIHFGQTAPKAQYNSVHAFVAEFIISFLLMLVILLGLSHRRYEKAVPAAVGVLLALYIVIEMPFSGMSMNPARSTAGDVAAQDFKHLWIYFTAPVLAMLLATVLFRWVRQNQVSVNHQDLPTYPNAQA